MSLKFGDTAPDFTLYNTAKQPVKLSELKGKPVVLLFFPLAFTSTCTEELCSVRDDLSSYNGMDATVFGISVDTPHTLVKFKEEQQLNFELLSDFNKEASAAYGCQYESFTAMGLKGVAKRSAFVVDRNGKIAYAEVLENAGALPDLNAVKQALSNS